MTYIKKIDIAVFGKFRGFCMEFEKGYNEFVLENEFGKSTITDFIIFILYGFTKSTAKNKTLDQLPLKKYMPWDGDGKISGALELISDGKFYRIERYQRETGSGAFKVRDEGGAEINITESPGKYFFSVDYDTFLRTFSVRQTDMAFYKTDGIESALKNLVSTGDESVSYEAAADILQKKKTKYRHAGRSGGLIFSIPKEITEFEQQNFSLRRQMAMLEESFAELSDVKNRLNVLEKTEAAYNEALKAAKASDCARDLQKLTAMDKDIASLRQKLDSMDAGKSETELKESIELFNELELCKKKLEQSTVALGDAKAEAESLENEFPSFELFKQNEQEIRTLAYAKSKVNTLLLILGIVIALIGGAVAAFAFAIFGIAVLTAGAILTVLAFIIKTKVKIPEKYAKDQAELCALYEKYCGMQNKLPAAKAFHVQAQSIYEKDLESYENQVNICKKTGFDTKSEVTELIALMQNAEVVKNQLSRLCADRELFIAGRNVSQIATNAEGGDVNGPTEREVQTKLTEISEQKRILSARLLSLSSNAEQKTDIEKQIYENLQSIEKLKLSLADAQYNDEVLALALDALAQAHDKINSIYSPILSEKAKKPLFAFTDGKYEKLLLDKNFEIRLQNESETKELGYFSKGTQEAVYFALRSAVGEIIAGEDGLPLILDDPFWALDTERLTKAREHLEKMSEQKQIIVFSAR